MTHGSAHSSSILLAVAAIFAVLIAIAFSRRFSKVVRKLVTYARKGADMVANFLNAAIALGDWAGTCAHNLSLQSSPRALRSKLSRRLAARPASRCGGDVRVDHREHDHIHPNLPIN